jgi:hypothetical protein
MSFLDWLQQLRNPRKAHMEPADVTLLLQKDTSIPLEDTDDPGKGERILIEIEVQGRTIGVSLTRGDFSRMCANPGMFSAKAVFREDALTRDPEPGAA